MFSRTARIAGKRPPSRPMARAISTPCSSTAGPKRNANVISLNVAQFAVPVERPLNGSVARQPSRPPTRQSSTDSNRNDDRMLRRLKPRARSVPISRPRLATAAIHRVGGGEHRPEREEPGDDVADELDRDRRRHLVFVSTSARRPPSG